MKIFLASALAALMIMSSSVSAHQSYDRHNTHEVMGRVISVNSPIYEMVQVRQDCNRYNQHGYHFDNRRVNGGNVAGAIVGGALGSQIGDGRGRDLAMVTGAVVGYQLGGQVNRNHYNSRCGTRYERQIVGYNFTARYRDTVVRGQTNRQPYIGMRVPMLVRENDDNYDNYEDDYPRY